MSPSRLLSLLLALGLLSLGLPACGGCGDDDDAADDDDDDSAPAELNCPANDSYETNQSSSSPYALGQLSMGANTIEGILCPASVANPSADVDWFSFSFGPFASCYDLEVESAASNGVAVELTGANGNQITSGVTTPSSSFVVPNQTTPIITHMVGFSRNPPVTVAPRRYTLTITPKSASNCP